MFLKEKNDSFCLVETKTGDISTDITFPDITKENITNISVH